MALCPFASKRPITGSLGRFARGPYKIVHHTTESATATAAMESYASHGADPHFTVDATRIYQHIDTCESARALRNCPGGLENNRDSAIQLALVGYAHLPKDPAALVNLARLCRWIEETHGVPRLWPAGTPRASYKGRDPGGHGRDADIWHNESGHYGHCHVPGDTHWDPGYTAAEAAFVLAANFDEQGMLTTQSLAALKLIPPRAAMADIAHVTTMPDHALVEEDGWPRYESDSGYAHRLRPAARASAAPVRRP